MYQSTRGKQLRFVCKFIAFEILSVTLLWLSLFVSPQWEEYEASDLMTPDQQRAHLDKLTKTTSENQVCWSFHLPHTMLKKSMILEEIFGELLDNL